MDPMGMISWLVGDEQMNAIFKKTKMSQAGRLKNVSLAGYRRIIPWMHHGDNNMLNKHLVSMSP